MSHISRRQLLGAAGGGVASVLFGFWHPVRRPRRAHAAVTATYELVVGSLDGTILLADRVPMDSAPTALEFLHQATNQTVATTRHDSLGFLVTGIQGVPQTATRYWYYWVNGTLANVGAGRQVLDPGALVIWILAPQASPTLFVRGDANGDGVLDVADPITTLLHLYRGRPLACPDAADVDDDGQIRLNDPIMLLTTLFRAGPPPRSPFPWPGLDPTPDRLGCAR